MAQLWQAMLTVSRAPVLRCDAVNLDITKRQEVCLLRQVKSLEDLLLAVQNGGRRNSSRGLPLSPEQDSAAAQYKRRIEDQEQEIAALRVQAQTFTRIHPDIAAALGLCVCVTSDFTRLAQRKQRLMSAGWHLQAKVLHLELALKKAQTGEDGSGA